MVRLLTVATALAGASAARAATIEVPADQPTIQAAIDVAVSGADEVVVAPGVYREHIDFTGKAITVRSVDPADHAIVAATIIDGTNSGTVVSFASGEGPGSVLDGLTIANGSASTGGGVRIAFATPTIRRCIFDTNRASVSGGGLFVFGDAYDVPIEACAFRNNRADNGGAVYVNLLLGNDVIVDSCSFVGNAADGNGGAIRAEGVLVLRVIDGVVRGNTAICADGGGIWSNTGTPPRIGGTSFCRNWPNDSTFFADLGGNTFDDGCPHDVFVVGADVATIQEGIDRAANGDHVVLPPGVHVETIDFGGRGVTVRSQDGADVTVLDGGGAASVATIDDCEGPLATLEDLTITGGSATNGGGVRIGSANPRIVGCVLTGNDAAERGGAVHVASAGGATITGATIASNTAGTAGGGVAADVGATVALADSGLCANAPDHLDGLIALAGLVFVSDDPGCAPIVALGACCLGSACVVSREDDCIAGGGAYLGDDSTCDACPEACPWDFGDDGAVGFDDLLLILSNWGPCPS